MIIQNSMTDKNCPTVNTTQQPTMADFFSFLFLGMLLGGGKSNAGFDKLGETLKRAVSEGNNTENIAELATSLNLPAEKVQEAINKIKGQLKNTSNDNQ